VELDHWTWDVDLGQPYNRSLRLPVLYSLTTHDARLLHQRLKTVYPISVSLCNLGDGLQLSKGSDTGRTLSDTFKNQF
jgi:hypothetical protein